MHCFRPYCALCRPLRAPEMNLACNIPGCMPCPTMPTKVVAAGDAELLSPLLAARSALSTTTACAACAPDFGWLHPAASCLPAFAPLLGATHRAHHTPLGRAARSARRARLSRCCCGPSVAQHAEHVAHALADAAQLHQLRSTLSTLHTAQHVAQAQHMPLCPSAAQHAEHVARGLRSTLSTPHTAQHPLRRPSAAQRAEHVARGLREPRIGRARQCLDGGQAARVRARGRRRCRLAQRQRAQRHQRPAGAHALLGCERMHTCGPCANTHVNVWREAWREAIAAGACPRYTSLVHSTRQDTLFLSWSTQPSLRVISLGGQWVR